MKKLFPIIFLFLSLGQTLSSFAGDPVFRYLDTEDFEKLDFFLADNDIDDLYSDSAVTLLVYSIFNSTNHVTRYLIEKGADVNLFVHGKSPLMHAAISGNKSKAALLIEHRAEINALDSSLNTSLIHAARQGNLKMVKYLVRNGAALNHKNIFWLTAYDESVNSGHHETAKYLRDEYVKNLPDFFDGPHISWKGRRRVKAFYMVHDSASRRTYRQKARFKVASDPVLMGGFSGDTLDYLVSKQREIPDDQFQNVEKIMVMGDIHGGYDSLLVFLLNNRVIDQGLNWIWEKGHLVFLGDIFDRGEKVTEVLWLIYRLEYQARNAGGAVHLILGNHEIMVLEQEESYVADKYLLMADKLNLTYAGLFGKQSILGQWLRTRNTLLKINDNLFVHAGLSPAFVNHGFTLAEINDHVRFFINYPQRESYRDVPRNSILGKDGPFWYRGYMEENHEYDHMPEEALADILTAYRAGRIFIGHTNVEKITPLYHGRVYAMDVPFYTNKFEIQGIIIENDDIYPLNSSGSRNEFR